MPRKKWKWAGATCLYDDGSCGEVQVQGMCRKHYKRLWTTGSPHLKGRQYSPKLACRIGGCKGLGTSKVDLCNKHRRRVREKGTPYAPESTETHCRWGHPWAENAGHFPGTGRRYCKACNNAHVKDYQRKKREQQQFAALALKDPGAGK